MYYRLLISARNIRSETSNFPIILCLSKESDLHPCTFNIVIDGFLSTIRYDVLRYILFINDIVLVDDGRTGINYILELSR